MSASSRPHPPAGKHGELHEVLPDVFFVTGTVGMPGPLPIKFSRNMTVLRRGDRLVLVNTVRLDDTGLEKLDKLGKVTDILRLAANHGADDPFYAERYGATTWMVKGQRYTAGFDTSSTKTYYTPDREMDATTALPIEGAKLVVLDGNPPEGLLALADGTVISGDCLQNWAHTDEYFSWLGKAMMKMMGFIKPYNVGPAWLRQTKPPKPQLRALLDIGLVNLLPAHGVPVIGDAREHFKAALERVST